MRPMGPIRYVGRPSGSRAGRGPKGAVTTLGPTAGHSLGRGVQARTTRADRSVGKLRGYLISIPWAI
jgi:hypothetical protein